MKIKDQSLISNYTYDYHIPDLVNYVFTRDSDDGQLTMVSDLKDEQLRPALNLYVREYNKLKIKVEKAKDVLEKIL